MQIATPIVEGARSIKYTCHLLRSQEAAHKFGTDMAPMEPEGRLCKCRVGATPWGMLASSKHSATPNQGCGEARRGARQGATVNLELDEQAWMLKVAN